MTASATRPDVVAPPERQQRRHIAELDVVRGVTMVGVIGVHTLSATTGGSDTAAGALTIMLHFTRESFFVLMAFVLVFSFRQRRRPWPAFWRKRFTLVAVPYVTWSAIYLAATKGTMQHSPLRVLHDFGYVLINGTAWYHLYFLLVTMQIYLLFPLIVWLVRVTERHHVALVAVAFAVQIGLSAVAQYGPTSRGAVGGWLWNHRDVMIISYPFFVLLGAVAGWHADDVLEWARSHVAAISVAVLGAVGITQAWYFIDIAVGESPGHADSVFQPAEVIWSVAAIAGLLALGSVWARRGKPGGVVRPLSRHSFGMFLVHPLVLNSLFVLGFVQLVARVTPELVTWIVIYTVVVLISIAFAVAASRTPVSLPLTGRPRFRRSAA
jgi:peptidoglycan/LPS O-acetylase OafA/YrhL